MKANLKYAIIFAYIFTIFISTSICSFSEPEHDKIKDAIKKNRELIVENRNLSKKNRELIIDIRNLLKLQAQINDLHQQRMDNHQKQIKELVEITKLKANK